MLDYYSDRYPKLFALVLVLAITVLPMLFVFAVSGFFGSEFPYSQILVAFAFAIQIVLCFKVENMFHMILPFVVMLIGVLICECLYLTAEVTYELGAWSVMEFGQVMLSLGVAAFAPEFVGIVAALIAYAVIAIVRSFIGK